MTIQPVCTLVLDPSSSELTCKTVLGLIKECTIGIYHGGYDSQCKKALKHCACTPDSDKKGRRQTGPEREINTFGCKED